MKNKEKKPKNMKIFPLRDRVLIDPEETDAGAEKKTASGIFIPETGNREKPEQGIVAAVGEGDYDDGKLIPLKVKIGDKVVFQKYGHDEIKVGGKKYFIMKEENILAVIK
jgi:chaperonin GroES